ncbi:MAG TPA: DMT family transporter [Rhodanobacteraceae bacterium]|jgi:drug/metabolite transporter (DMT)-like permease|nr:DMT family transporter [Rhodanobacteraceae bacterium]
MRAIAGGHLRGVLCMLMAVAAFSLMDASMKILALHYPPMQVAALRGITSLPLVIVWASLDGGLAQLFRVRWPLHVLRGGLSVVMLVAFVYGLKRLPLAETYSLFFVAPLLITALAVPILGEKVGWRRWAAIVVGLLGTVIVLRPTGAGMFSLGGVAVMVSAACYAASAITVRVLGRTDSTQSMVVWMLAMLSVFSLALAWPHWLAIDPAHWKPIAILALTGALGQYGVTEAFRRAPVSLVAPLEYTALVWGLALDWFLWATLPDGWMIGGAVVIVLCGLYLLRSERVHVEAEHP